MTKLNSPIAYDYAGHFISAPWRSSGKSIVSMGLAKLASQRALDIQTFKKGPDFIDPQWLKQASSKPCYNLDSYLQDENDIKALVAKHASNCVLVEGTMGLHDGLCVNGSDSNAAIAKLLGLPVLLVIDCRGMHRTLAPLLNGMLQFDTDVAFSGIILNRIRSERHAGKIQRAINQYCDIDVLGLVPDLPALAIDERELGLVPAADFSASAEFIDTVAHELEKNCDIQKIFTPNCHVDPPRDSHKPATCANGNISQTYPVPLIGRPRMQHEGNDDPLRIGVAKDEAFHFYYQDDLDYLEDAGVTLLEFSPLRDELPPDLDGLIIGGGFPERHLNALSENVACREAIARAIKNGLPVRAECGGLMYLCRSINVDNVVWPMVGVVPGSVVMHDKPKGRGYMQLKSNTTHTRAATSTSTKGDSLQSILPAHEFHHSTIDFDTEPDCMFDVKRGYGLDGKRDGVCIHNLIASYAHFRHTPRSPWIDWFLESIQHEVKRHSRAESHV